VLIGILNVTPDSFSDGGEWNEPRRAVEHGLSMVAAGATVIDVGGESTRPGAAPVSLDEEASRAIPVVRELVDGGVVVSIDTYKADMARLAIQAGASIVNDVTGFGDREMIEAVAGNDVGVVVMHGRGQALDDRPPDDDPVSEVADFLRRRTASLIDVGVDRERIAIDPGLGFAKRHEQSLALVAGVDRLAQMGFPVMVGASRKGFLTGLAGALGREARDSVTAAITALTFTRGASLFRVHDVARSRDALRLAGAIVASQ
jgi:dihydropteroate synthase